MSRSLISAVAVATRYVFPDRVILHHVGFVCACDFQIARRGVTLMTCICGNTSGGSHQYTLIIKPKKSPSVYNVVCEGDG